MSGYIYTPDGKLHTRYSELVRCTPGQIDRVLYERENGAESFSNEHTLDGTERHEMFAEESKRTGLTPEIFRRALAISLPVDFIEDEFVSEIFPDVVLHSRLDAVSTSEQVVIDYKTITGDPGAYTASKQLRLYAFQLALHGFRIKEGLYLFEIWETNVAGERDKIVGHHYYRFPIPMLDMTAARDWARPRAALLQAALNERSQ